jgi:hypothetical protein
MSRSPIGFQTQHGHTAPLCTQFSVFLDNRVGKLYELLEAFDGQPSRIVALSVVDSSDYAVVRLMTTNAEAARRLLDGARHPYTQAEILVVALGGDKQLPRLCLSLLSAELNIYYAYPLMVAPHGEATLAIQTDDQVLAGQILQRKGFRILGENELENYRDEDSDDPMP